MGRRLWSPYARKRNDACRRTASRTPSGPGTLRDTIPREHFFAVIQFNGPPRTRPCALLVAEDITILQRVEEARFALAQRLTSPISVNGSFLELALQEIAYEGTKAICPPSNCR
jgi:hypothetical protein